MMAEDVKDALSLTDDEENEEIDEEFNLPEVAGTLCKWTNYIHGWQDRYIVLKDGTLSYYKSETETSFGCRGAISLGKAVIQPHEFDECRFDVSVNDCLWYLRARNEEERNHWIDAIELNRQAESGYGSENGLRRHGSMLSLASGTSLSTASASSFKRGRGLREKLAEMETFRDILCRQVDTLQSYFDACSSALAHYQKTVHDVQNDESDEEYDLNSGTNKSSTTNSETSSNSFMVDGESQNVAKDMVNILQQHGAHAIDFKGESFTFKATTAGILSTLSHCIDLMSQREESWKRRLDREVEKRKRYEEAYRNLQQEKPKQVVLGGPDFEEGPHCLINDDEFFDAVDSALDKLEKDQERVNMKAQLVTKTKKTISCKPPITSLDPSHELYDEINKIVNDHITHADMTAADVASSWQLLAEDGEMRVYKRELEEDGMVVDPLKAVHTIKGVTGHEMCHYFWNPEVRMEWEGRLGTLDSSQVLSWFSKDTNVSYQVYKRIWPASQRESLFWSTIRHCPSEDDEGPDYWIVANHSTEHPEAPMSGKQVRVRFNVAMICQTIVHPPENNQEITRENLTCKIQYSANVNPGGWAPASVIRVISKRELPKFLKTFTAYVIEKTKDQPILL